MNRNAFKSCAVIWRIMRPYLKIERKATARSGKTFEKWKIILNLKETLTDTESISLFPEMGICATLF